MFTFRPDEWNESQVQLATVTVSDDAVDSAQDTEDFTLTHFVSTTDAVYSNKFKVTNLIVVVRVQDDDTAGVVLDGGPAGALQLVGRGQCEGMGAHGERGQRDRDGAIGEGDGGLEFAAGRLPHSF